MDRHKQRIHLDAVRDDERITRVVEVVIDQVSDVFHHRDVRMNERVLPAEGSHVKACDGVAALRIHGVNARPAVISQRLRQLRRDTSRRMNLQ